MVVSHADGKLSDADAANLGALRGILGERLVGEVPPLEAGAEPDEGVFSPGWLAALPGALGVGNGRV